jgi:hypothetical protein
MWGGIEAKLAAAGHVAEPLTHSADSVAEDLCSRGVRPGFETTACTFSTDDLTSWFESTYFDRPQPGPFTPVRGEATLATPVDGLPQNFQDEFKKQVASLASVDQSRVTVDLVDAVSIPASHLAICLSFVPGPALPSSERESDCWYVRRRVLLRRAPRWSSSRCSRWLTAAPCSRAP